MNKRILLKIYKELNNNLYYYINKNRLSKKLNLNFRTIKNYLEIFKELKVFREVEEDELKQDGEYILDKINNIKLDKEER